MLSGLDRLLTVRIAFGCCRSCFHLHLLAGLTDFCEAALLVAQLIGQFTAQVSFAVAVISLGIQGSRVVSSVCCQ